MIDAINEAASFIEGVQIERFNTDRKLILSVIKEIEIIGEAAARLSDETMNKYPGIPWKDIVGMRNRLIILKWMLN